jgi:hypothetical protein
LPRGNSHQLRFRLISDRKIADVGTMLARPAKSRASAISSALGRLRVAINTGCWIMSICLASQIVVWSLVTLTDLRFQEAKPAPTVPVVIAAEENKRPVIFSTAEAEHARQVAAATEDAPPLPPAMSIHDRTFRALTTFGSALGTLTMLAILPLFGVGVVLCAGSATPGVEKTVSAFAWAVMLTLLVLPVGATMNLSMGHGVFVSYAELTTKADAARAAAPDHNAAMFYGRFLLLPAACIVGTCVVALRFGAGVEAGLLPWDGLDIDPSIESEAANVKASSLIGGRSTASLRRSVSSRHETPPEESHVPLTQPSPGERPRRLI